MRSGQHDADGADLVRSDLAGQTRMVEAVVDRFRAVGHALRKFDQFFVPVGKRRYGIRRHLRPLDMRGHPYFIARCFIQMQYSISHILR